MPISIPIVLLVLSPLWFYAASRVAGRDLYEFRAYLTTIGLAALASWTVAIALTDWTVVPLLILMGLYAVQTRVRIRMRSSVSAYWQTVLSSNPDNLRAKNQLGVSYLQRNLFEYARETFESILATPGPSNTAEHAIAFLNLVYTDCQLGNWETAEVAAREGLRRHAPFPNLSHTLACIRMRAGDFEEARALLDEAIEQKPGEPQFHAARAECLMYLGDHASARADYERSAVWNSGRSVPTTTNAKGIQ